jgi:hypothetical protein
MKRQLMEIPVRHDSTHSSLDSVTSSDTSYCYRLGNHTLCRVDSKHAPLWQTVVFVLTTRATLRPSICYGHNTIIAFTAAMLLT